MSARLAFLKVACRRIPFSSGPVSGSGSQSQPRRGGLALRDDTDSDPEKAVETEKRLKEDLHPRRGHKSRDDGFDNKQWNRCAPGPGRGGDRA